MSKDEVMDDLNIPQPEDHELEEAMMEIRKILQRIRGAQLIKGRWIRRESALSWWYECSECGDLPLFDPYEHEVRTPFCPWCGARMEEEDDETD